MSAKVTILIPVYNGSNFIKQAIESALNQTYENIEVLVINDGSTDNGKTEKIIEQFGNKIKYIKKENGGVASALNLGIKEAQGDYISWLSHDDIYLPNKIEKEINALNNIENKKTIIFSNFELINGNGEHIVTTDYTKNINKEKLCQSLYPVIKGCVNGCTTLIPKNCFNEVGNFKEELRTTNDYDMWVRLFNKYPSYFIEEPLIKYRIHENQDTNKSPVYVSESNELWKSIISNLTEGQIAEWGFDKFNVYMTLYIQMKNSKFDEAAKVAYEKAKKIYTKNVPEISIAMPCYNSEKYLSKAIESILEQSYCNFELIIVDDNSTDKTMLKIKEYEKTDFRIKVFKNEFKKGVAGAMNTAIRHSRGKYITRMDSDDISVIDRIEKQYNFLENNKQYGVCSVNISMMDEFGNIYNEAVYPNSKIPHEWTFLWTNPIPNAPCMYKSDIIKKDNILFRDLKTAEDYDFLSNIILKEKVYSISEPLYYYRHTSNSLFNSNINETFQSSQEISKNFFKRVVQEDPPEYYNNLTFFWNAENAIVNEDIKIVNKFLVNTAKKFKEYFNWNIEEYELVIYEIPEILERYVILKNGINSKSMYAQGKTSKILIMKRLVKKTSEYMKKNGLLKTIKVIFKKIKGILFNGK